MKPILVPMHLDAAPGLYVWMCCTCGRIHPWREGVRPQHTCEGEAR